MPHPRVQHAHPLPPHRFGALEVPREDPLVDIHQLREALPFIAKGVKGPNGGLPGRDWPGRSQVAMAAKEVQMGLWKRRCEILGQYSRQPGDHGQDLSAGRAQSSLQDPLPRARADVQVEGLSGTRAPKVRREGRPHGPRAAAVRKISATRGPCTAAE